MRLAASILAAWLCLTTRYAPAQTTLNRWDPALQAKPVAPALGGYCVVTLRNQHQWQPGDERWSVFFDGRRYQFATARERDIFTSSPEAYAPMLRGDCPVTLAEMGKRARGRLEYGVLHGGRLIFFASEDDRRYFLADPAQFNNVDLAIGGRCIVSRRDHQKDVAGIPETAAVHGGLRFLFASAHDRALFLQNPARYDGSGGSEADRPPESPIASEQAKGASGATMPWNRSAENSETRSLGSNEEDVILSALPSMAGYCPVTLRKEGSWIRGRYEYRVELGEYVFLTVGPKERPGSIFAGARRRLSGVARRPG
jgi:YHS domain-containing protein